MSNLSFVRHKGDGVTNQFALSVAGENIGYFRISDIHGYVDDKEVPITIDPNSPHIVRFTETPQLNADILIRRKMPVKKTYADFERGNNFGHRQINNTFVQQLYLTQELLDGFFPSGFYFKQDVDLGGHKITNLGDATEDGDAVNKKVTDSLNKRLESLENSVSGDSRFLPWTYNAVGGEDTLNPPYKFESARVFINGVRQRAGESFEIVDLTIMLAEPLEEGDWVDVELGTEPKDGVVVSAELDISDHIAKAKGSIENRTLSDRFGDHLADKDGGFISETGGWPELENPQESIMKAESRSYKDEEQFVNKGTMKSWRVPVGIKETATAGSFILSSSDKEPATQVTGFTDYSKIGTYVGRDAVAIYAQVDSSPATVTDTNAIYENGFITLSNESDMDKVTLGMIADVNYGGVNWVGCVVIGKTKTKLIVSPWVKVDGSSAPTAAPTGGTLQINRHSNIWAANFNALTTKNGGANQAIGIETGLSCAGTGTGANSKCYYAVNLGGEEPEYCFTMSGKWQKGYTSSNCSLYGFQSESDRFGFRSYSSIDTSYISVNPAQQHINCSSANGAKFAVDKDAKIAVGNNPPITPDTLFTARGWASRGVANNETLLHYLDPTSETKKGQGFYINQRWSPNSIGASYNIGVGDTGTHTFELVFETQSKPRVKVTRGGNWSPAINGGSDLGDPSSRWNELYLVNPTVNPSDVRLKDFFDIENSEKSAALEIKSIIKKFKWKKEVSVKGDTARYHFGVGAQLVRDVLIKHNLKPEEYSFLCYDEWDSVLEGDSVVRESGNSWGIRYGELAMFLLAAL